MFASISNEKGFSMIEVLIALILVVFGVMGFISMQTQGWVLSGKSDFIGRAAEILHREIESTQLLMMNPCNNVTTGALPAITVYSSGQASEQTGGDATYTVQKTITSVGINLWTLTVAVSWAGNNNSGVNHIVKGSVTVTQQEFARFPAGCVNGLLTPNFNL